MTEKSAPQPQAEVHCRDVAFKGMLWLPYHKVDDATSALTALTEVMSKDREAKHWCNYDLPIEERVENSILFGVKTKLVEWKVGSKKHIRIDTDTKIMKAWGKEVLQATVVGDSLEVKWLSSEWEAWDELQQNPDIKEIIQRARERLAKSRTETGKGAGKGLQ